MEQMDCNNSNSPLNDILTMFNQEEGSLTPSDRLIPEDEMNDIRRSVFASDSEEIPLLRKEDGSTSEQMKNNFVFSEDKLCVRGRKNWKREEKQLVMSRRSGSSSEDGRPPRRQCTLRRLTTDDRAQPPLHYTYQDEITLGMNRLTVTNKEIPETEDDDDENEDVDDEDELSESSSSASSSSSEYQPGPSSPHRVSVEKNAKRKESQRSSPPIARRLRKKQKMHMTQKELDDRRKEANKKNSKNYNANKKKREQLLMDEYARKKEHLHEMHESNSRFEVTLSEYYGIIRDYMKIPDEEIYYIDQKVYIAQKQKNDAEIVHARNNDKNIKKLYQNLTNRKRLYDAASKDLNLKRFQTNTYGSRKSRALHSMNIAKYEYKVADLEFEVVKQREWSHWMTTVKQELVHVFNWKNVVVDYAAIASETKNKIDWMEGLLLTGS